MKTFRVRIFRTVIISIIVLIFCLLGIYLGFWYWIKTDVNKYCNDALRLYPGDRVEALISVLKSETSSLTEKNEAIWTLEYIGDERALSTLKKLLTGTNCNHSEYVCQRELIRAIGNIEGTNIVLIKFK